MKNYKHVCETCKGTNVGVQRWVNPNDDSIHDADCGSLEWCFGECQDETTLEIVDEEYPDHVPVAYFAKDGSVRCEDCIGAYRTEPNSLWDGVTPTKIYPENLRPYSQTCHSCSKMVFKGSAPNILFENKNEPIPVPAATFVSPLDCGNCGHGLAAHSHDLDEDRWCTTPGCECTEYVPIPNTIDQMEEVLEELEERYEPVTKWDNVYEENIIVDDGTFKGMFDFIPDFYERRFTSATKYRKRIDGSVEYYIPILPSDRMNYPQSTRLKDHKYVVFIDGSPRDGLLMHKIPSDATPLLVPNTDRFMFEFDPYDCEVCEAMMNAGYEMDFIEAYHNQDPDAVLIAEKDPKVTALIEYANGEDL